MAGIYCTGIANITIIASILLVAVSFSTDQWIVVTVSRVGLKDRASTDPALNISLYTKSIYYTRHRGLFKTCYCGDDLSWIEAYKVFDAVVDERCLLEAGYEIVQRPSSVGYGAAYHMRKHLMRAQVSFYVIGMTMLLLGLVGGTCACFGYRVSYLRVTGLFVFLGSFFISGGMALFHGVEYLERQKIDIETFYKSWSQEVPLRDYCRYEYGFSYILGWLGTSTSFTAAVIFILSAHKMASCKHKGHKKCKSKEKRNRAYDYMEQAFAVPYPAKLAGFDSYYYR